jgi:DNA-binding NarL/FixJ family response regulator
LWVRGGIHAPVSKYITEEQTHMTKHYRIIIADGGIDFPVYMKEELEREPDMTVVAMTRDGDEVPGLITLHQPDILITELVFTRGWDGLSILRILNRISHDRCPAVIISTAYGSHRISIEARRLGVAGYLLKPYAVSELVRLIRHRGKEI